MHDKNVFVLNGFATAEPSTFIHYNGEHHVRLEPHASLLLRDDEPVVTIVGIADMLRDGNVLVLE